MDDDSVRAVQRVVMFGVLKALIRSHPDQNALRVAWASVSAELGTYSAVIGEQMSPERLDEAQQLLASEIDRWTRQIHQKE